MALAFLPSEKFPNMSPREIAEEVMSIVTSHYHFNTVKNTIGNANTKSSFAAHMENFIEENLDYRPNAPSTPRSLEAVYHGRHKEYPRDEVVPLDAIRSLTVGCACFLLKLGYRGFLREEVMNKFRRELIWLLEQRGFILRDQHTLFCPLLTVWEEDDDWRVLRDNDRGEKGPPPIPSKPKLLAEACKLCIL